MKLSSVAFYVVLFFAMIGMTLSVVFVHELSHWNDFHKLMSDDGIYLFEISGNFSGDWLKTPFAKYEYVFNEKNAEQVKKVDSYTEYKAYTVTIQGLCSGRSYDCSLSYLSNFFC